MNKRILLIRTHKPLNAGGPVPPLGLLYIASAIMKNFGEKYEIRILHFGLKNLLIEDAENEIESFQPHLVGLSVLTCEADLMHEIAKRIKKISPNTLILVGGPHASLAKQYLLQDKNIDYGITGEGETTIIEFLKAWENLIDPSKIDGLVYRDKDRNIFARPHVSITDLDNVSILPYVWDLIDIKEYGKYNNWNGTCKEKFYASIITSRGCPFNCTFCRSRDVFGTKFRARSPENVFSEILFLSKKLKVKEIHFFDDVFNFDAERVKRICSLIIDSGLKLSLAFPNGLRADIMNSELIDILKKAGAYKINYGIETVNARIQRMIKKELNIRYINEIISKTVKSGIITTGYFILGFPGETHKEMIETIDFAVNSDLDNAYFFKYTDFSNIVFSNHFNNIREDNSEFINLHFHSSKNTSPGINNYKLNHIILKAQQRFYLNIKRLTHSLVRSPNKLLFLRGLFQTFALILQSYLITKFENNKQIYNSVV